MDIISRLTNLFSDFPTVGPRTAGRFVFYLTKIPKEKAQELANAILELKNKIKFCIFCQNPFEGEGRLCSICENYNRNKTILCVVEKEQDLISIEKTGKYKGLYFVLNLAGSLSKNAEINSIKLEGLKQRIKNSEKFLEAKTEFSEIIIATNPTPEGINASILVQRALKEIDQSFDLAQGKPPAFKITHLAKGIPVGGELEYADQETLESAFEGRK